MKTDSTIVVRSQAMVKSRIGNIYKNKHNQANREQRRTGDTNQYSVELERWLEHESEAGVTRSPRGFWEI